MEVSFKLVTYTSPSTKHHCEHLKKFKIQTSILEGLLNLYVPMRCEREQCVSIDSTSEMVLMGRTLKQAPSAKVRKRRSRACSEPKLDQPFGQPHPPEFECPDGWFTSLRRMYIQRLGVLLMLCMTSYVLGIVR